MNEHPNGTFNGTFSVLGTETGNPFADFLIGVPSNYTQTGGQAFYLRDHYISLFGEDSWRARNDLTINYGVRWEVIRPWSEKYNNIQTYIPGAQSTLYPNAIPGMVVPGDPGISSTISPTKYDKFAPRIGLAVCAKLHQRMVKEGIWLYRHHQHTRQLRHVLHSFPCSIFGNHVWCSAVRL